MAKVKLPYTVNNRLAEYIQRKAEQTNSTITEIEAELAEYCNLTVNEKGKAEAIKKYKQGNIDPSLPVAMRICEYFGTSMEEMYKLMEV